MATTLSGLKSEGFWGRLARGIARAAARFYYPAIEISGCDQLPAEGPLLIAANHQNSLLDPVLIGLAVRRPVGFLAKAPLFEIPIVGHLLHAFGMLPVHRRSDDPTRMHRNLAALAGAAARLEAGQAVGIFPEGRSHDAPRLEPIKTGAARLAIQAVRAGAKDLRLVPVGINYQRKEQFRSAVWIRVGAAIDVAEWLKERAGSGANDSGGSTGSARSDGGTPLDEGAAFDRRLVRELSAELDRRLRELVVDLDDPAWEPFLRDLEVLLPPPAGCRRNPFAWLRQRKRLADAIQYFMRQDPEGARAVAGRLEDGRARLAAAGMTMRSSVLRWRGFPLVWRLLGEAVLMNVGFLAVLVGTLYHLPPFLLTRGLARLVRPPGRSVVALARFGVGLPIYGGWYGVNAWWISQYFLPWVAAVWLVPMPAAGLLALRYWRRVRRNSPAWWRDVFMMITRPRRLRELRAEHACLRDALDGLAREYARVRPAEALPGNAFSWRRLAWAAGRAVGKPPEGKLT